jgi:hypothetical protein
VGRFRFARVVSAGVVVAAASLGVLLAVVVSPPPVARARAGGSACVLPILCTTTTTTTTTPVTFPPPPTTTTTSAPPGRHRKRPKPKVVYPYSVYAGRTANFSHVVSVSVSRNGHRIDRVLVEFRHGRCNDGQRYAGQVVRVGAWSISERGKGVFAVHSRHAYWFNKAGHRVNGSESTVMHFRFDGNRMSSTLVDRFSGGGIHCASGAVRMQAARVGTARAPIYDAGAVSGAYSGGTAHGRWRFFAYVPLHMVSELKYHWTLRCPKGKTYRYTTEFVDIPLKIYSDDQDYFNASSNATAHHETRGIAYTVQSSINAEGWISLKPRTSGRRVTLHATAQLSVSGSVTATTDVTGAEFYHCYGGYTTTGRTATAVRLPPGKPAPFRN